MKIALQILMLSGIFLMGLSFQKVPMKSQQQLMKEYIDEKLADRRAEEWKKCRTEIVNKAERYVDSIIYRQVNFNIGDSLRAPGKPAKPAKPFDTLKLDSTPIKPILGDSLTEKPPK
ncbi:hypothetical protein [Portibacter marinus]|uniref:hypothetical protein n=1 Tax=Portibacter marinus TaxID=2898660 RepID=UPI001F3AFC6F|nr:hypothetical protein [Portibacter marinus]